MIRAQSNNRLVNSLAYAKILDMYNDRLKRDGKVNNKKFYEEIVSKEIKNYSMQSWYNFVRKFETEAGIIADKISIVNSAKEAGPQAIEGEVSTTMVKTMLSNQEATQSLIKRTLNISASAAQDIMENPHLLSPKDRIELGIKAMKAQDSRIHAVGKIREDSREQEKFDRAFNEAQY